MMCWPRVGQGRGEPQAALMMLESRQTQFAPNMVLHGVCTIALGCYRYDPASSSKRGKCLIPRYRGSSRCSNVEVKFSLGLWFRSEGSLQPREQPISPPMFKP